MQQWPSGGYKVSLTLGRATPPVRDVIGDMQARFDAGDIDGCLALGLKAAPSWRGLAQFWTLLGACYERRSQGEDAYRCHVIALALEPAAPLRLYNFAIALNQAGADVAVENAWLKRAIALAPDDAKIWAQLANGLARVGERAETGHAGAISLSLDPNHTQAMMVLANLASTHDRHDIAVPILNRVLTLNPDLAFARFLRALGLLLEGQFEQGWLDYEGRRQAAEFKYGFQTHHMPEWQLGTKSGQTVLVQLEQGMGDVLQFCRYVPLIAQAGHKVILQVQPPLLRLMETLAGVSGLVPDGITPSGFDAYVPVGSLPGKFWPHVGAHGAAVPYLRADPVRVARWRTWLGTSKPLKVGIIWQGNPANAADRARSVPLTALRPLADLPEVELIVLQRVDGLAQLEDCGFAHRLRRPPSDFDMGDNRFMDTAALIQSLDVVVTVCTATAHLTGALGRPGFVLLKHVPDWRWGRSSDTSPWYPSLKLFRQEVVGDWQAPVLRIANALRALWAQKQAD